LAVADHFLRMFRVEGTEAPLLFTSSIAFAIISIMGQRSEAPETCRWSHSPRVPMQLVVTATDQSAVFYVEHEVAVTVVAVTDERAASHISGDLDCFDVDGRHG